MFTSSGFPFLNWVYSINSSKMIGDFPAVLNFNQLFLKLKRFICNQLPVLPSHWAKGPPDPENPSKKLNHSASNPEYSQGFPSPESTQLVNGCVYSWSESLWSVAENVLSTFGFVAMTRENWLLVIDEFMVEFEKWPTRGVSVLKF